MTARFSAVLATFVFAQLPLAPAMAQEGRAKPYIAAPIESARPVMAKNGMVVAQERRSAKNAARTFSRAAAMRWTPPSPPADAMAVTYPRAGNLGSSGSW